MTLIYWCSTNWWLVFLLGCCRYTVTPECSQQLGFHMCGVDLVWGVYVLKRYDLKECATPCVYWVNSIDVSLYAYLCIAICKSGFLQQPATARMAKTKADIAKKSSYSYSSRWYVFIYHAVDSHLRIVEDSEFYKEIRFHVDVFRFAKSKLMK